MYVGQLPVSCLGILYDLERLQDCSDHQTPLWSSPLQVMDVERAVGTFLSVGCLEEDALCCAACGA